MRTNSLAAPLSVSADDNNSATQTRLSGISSTKHFLALSREGPRGSGAALGFRNVKADDLDSVGVRRDDRAVATGKNHHFGHPGLGIEPDDVSGKACFDHCDIGVRVATTSGRHRVVNRGELVDAERGELKVGVIDGE